jgi:hypothetical protein
MKFVFVKTDCLQQKFADVRLSAYHKTYMIENAGAGNSIIENIQIISFSGRGHGPEPPQRSRTFGTCIAPPPV